jgi:hypothetical protein
MALLFPAYSPSYPGYAPHGALGQSYVPSAPSYSVGRDPRVKLESNTNPVAMEKEEVQITGEKKAKPSSKQKKRDAADAAAADCASDAADCPKCSTIHFQTPIKMYAWFSSKCAQELPSSNRTRVEFKGGRTEAATHLVPCDVHHGTEYDDMHCLGEYCFVVA